MLREGYIMQEITSYGNISEALTVYCVGKSERDAVKDAICSHTARR